MRIVHTSDWHAGRICWQGRSRLNELVAALDHLARFVETEKIDLLLMTGDVFDSGAPGADAERVVFQFLRRIGSAGAKSVVIAGNHDDPARMEAWATLAELVAVQAVARPKKADEGGTLEITTKSGQKAIVAALPFASVGNLMSAMEVGGDETKARLQYAERFKSMSQSLCARFRGDAVNLLLAHTHLDGATLANSERKVHVSEQWAAAPQSMPDKAHYVALGHIHKPQKIAASPVPTYYAGSPLQLDFGEMGEEKSFVFIEARSGQPAVVRHIPYEGGRQLREARATLTELEQRARELGDSWLRVIVPLERRDPDLTARVRKLVPDAVVIRSELTEIADSLPPPSIRGASPSQRYADYVRERARTPDPALLEAFEALRARCSSEGDEP
ncbi:MAG: exonuclease SbcCD subunit D [Polyangiaceae bacterium]